MKCLKVLPLLILVCACNQSSNINKFQLKLPIKSKDISCSNDVTESIVKLKQVGKDEIAIKFGDTITVPIKSPYLQNGFSIFNGKKRYIREEVMSADLYLDGDLSYHNFKMIAKQLRLVGFLRVNLFLENENPLSKLLDTPDGLNNNNPVKIEIENSIKNDNFLICKIGDGDLSFFYSNGVKVENVYEILFDINQHYLVIFDFLEESTYQDYINFYSLAFCSIKSKRDEWMSKGNSKSSAIDKFPFSLIDNEHLINMIPFWCNYQAGEKKTSNPTR